MVSLMSHTGEQLLLPKIQLIWRARVKIGEAHAPGGQFIENWGLDGTAVTAKIAVPKIVDSRVTVTTYLGRLSLAKLEKTS